MAAILIKDPSRVIGRRIDDVLHDLGLQRRDILGSAFTLFGLFGAGVALGATASLLLAPKSGSEMRRDLARRLGGLREEISSRAQPVGGAQRYTPPS